LNDSHIFGRAQITLYDSIIRPIAEYLKKKGVDFWDHAKIKAIHVAPDQCNDHATVTSINIHSQEGKDVSFTVLPDNICIINLGPIASTVALGSNFTSPERLGRLVEGAMNPDWSLWNEMSTKRLKLGQPSNFCSRLGESELVTFTTTLKSSPFVDLYTKLTGNQPGAGAFMTLGDSNWCLTINVPQQPVFHSQPENVHVIYGYGLNSHSDGNFILKPMYNCTGEEIMQELLSHLHFPLDPILDSSITIPCLIPYATSAMVTRKEGDRPEVIPPGTTNIGIVGQFVEIPDETTFSIDYSVRGAQLAVSRLMGTKEPKKSKKNRLLGAFDVLA
jgi:oleate hydratase